MALRAEWLESLVEIEGLEKDWRALEEAALERSVLPAFDMVVPWYRHYAGRRGEPLLGAVWDGPDLVAVLPFSRRRDPLGGIPVRKIDFAGYDGEAGELLFADGRADALVPAFQALRRVASFDVMCLRNMDGPQVAAVEAAARSAGLGMERGEAVYAVVDLEGGYEAYAKATGNRLRKDLKKRANKLAAAGGADLDGAHLGTDVARVAACVERSFAIIDASWKALESGPMATDHRGFYHELCERFARRGMADVSILRIGGADAAYLIGIVERGVYYDITVSYKEEFSGLAPGFQLMEHVLRVLPSLGVRRVVSHGAHEYKRRWATAFPSLAHRYLFRRGLRAGLSRLSKFHVAPALGRKEPLFD